VFLETIALTKRFGGVQAVDGVDLTVERGEIVGIIGPNGSGKTTLFNVITGLYPADSGDIRFGDPPLSLAGLRPHQVADTGIARTFQTLRLFPSLTVLENVLVAMHGRLKAGYWRALARDRGFREEERRAEEKALEVLSFFGQRLVSMCNEPASILSYANRRRLEIARVLASEAELILLDEPAAGMNPSETAELMRDITRIHQMGRTILVIEHDMTLIEGVTQRVVAFDHGAKIAEGSFAQVRVDPQVIDAYLGRRHGASAAS
jgi:ABC-type branched-subunit amino acid transport system ATPase component